MGTSDPEEADARRWRRAEQTAWAAYLMLGLAANLLGPALPELRDVLGVEYGALALVFPASAAGGVLSLIFGNRFLDRVGYRTTFVAASGVYGAGLLSLALTPNLGAWLAELFAIGLASSLIDLSGARFVNVLHHSGRSRALNLLNLFYSLGSMLGPGAVALTVGGHARVADVFLAAGGAEVLLALVFVSTFRSAHVWDRASVSPSLWEGWRWAAKQPWLLGLSVAVALYVGAEVAMSGWVSAYAHAVDHWSPAAAALLPLLFWAGMTVGRGLATERARRWPEERILGAGLALSLLGAALLLVPLRAAILACAAALTGVGFGPLFPTLISLGARRAPHHASEAFALLFPAGAAGNLLLPVLSGELFAHLGPTFAMGVPGTAIATVALFVWLLARPRPPA